MTNGCWVFLILVVWGLGCIGIGAFDLRLIAEKLLSLSERVWGGQWMLEVAILAWMFSGPIFVTGHFRLGWLKP